MDVLRFAIACIVACMAYLALRPSSQIRDALDGTYDYIIVGAGSAGAVLATRLSEEEGSRVLLLEAGGEENGHPNSHVPYLASSLVKTQLDWAYSTVPQSHSCKSMKHRRSFWPRGKVLGGSSTINQLQYLRGNRHDYDEWEAMGNPGWGYDVMLKYFKKSENQQNPHYANNGFHGTEGPLYVKDSYIEEAAKFVSRAFREKGVPAPHDVAGESQIGFIPNQVTVGLDGARCSTARCYLRPVMHRKNLHVATNAHITKVIIDNTTKIATSVQFMRNNVVETIHAKREIILSAGTVGSPQILMLSGIGPRDHLQELGIPVLVNLPVGNNLQDHIFIPVDLVSDTRDIVPKARTYNVLDKIQYELFGTGILSTAPAIGSAYKASKDKDHGKEVASVQLIPGATPFIPQHMLQMEEEIYDAMYKEQTAKSNGLTFLVTLLRPKSVGSIRLKSANPFEYPVINPRYLVVQDDVDVLLDGIKYILSMLKTETFQEAKLRVSDRLHPICGRDHDSSSDAYWECLIRHLTCTSYHPVGTCKMGPKSDQTAVVDSNLRVHGVKNLRVVDGSIMPYITRGNTNAPIIAIAEKAADIIREGIHV